MAYERKVRAHLTSLWPEAQHEQWFEFQDASGRGVCQTDHFVELDHLVLVFESKLTQTLDAVRQLNLLYRPVVEHITSKPTLGIQVCRNLVLDPGPGLIRNIRSLPTLKPSARVWTYHWRD